MSASPPTTPPPLPGGDDVIAALATAPGRGAIALLRLSGPGAHAVAARVVAPWPLPERAARRATLRDPRTGEVLDRAVVTAYHAPRSYTGEDVVEIATHGGLAVPTAVLAALVGAGAREALPGEFTRRALLNGKLDLVQAEAIGDLIDARSSAARRAALAQLDGGLSRRVGALREALLDVEALIAYDIDFPEEDDGPVPRAHVLAAARAAAVRLDALLASAPTGELVREGAVVVIAGPPNAGKSSLFNALLGARRAIVTPVPGTTRDALEGVVDAAPYPLRLVDTAGLREAGTDALERLGIEVSREWLARAQLVLACGDSADALADALARVRAHTAAPVLPVRTKADLDGAAPLPAGAVAVSAETGAGLDALVAAAERTLAAHLGAGAVETPLVTRARQRRALEEARGELAAFAEAWAADALPAPVAAVHLHAAVEALETLVGAVDVEEVLGRVFARFCVGK